MAGQPWTCGGVGSGNEAANRLADRGREALQHRDGRPCREATPGVLPDLEGCPGCPAVPTFGPTGRATACTLRPWRCTSSRHAPGHWCRTARSATTRSCAGWPRWPPRRCPYPMVSPECQEALDKRVICDMYEGHAPFTARYILPDYEKAIRQGLALPRDAAAHEPRRRARVPAGHVRERPQRHHLPGVPRRPRQGARPVRHRRHQRRRTGHASCADSGSASTACCPTRSCTSTSARTTAASPARSSVWSAACARACPTSPSRWTPTITPDDLIEDGVRTVFETGKPHFVNHPMMVGDHGERYAAVSCYNSLKIGGGAHTLVRLNLKEAALRHTRHGRRVPRHHAPPLRGAHRRTGRGPHPLARRATSTSTTPTGWPWRASSTSTGSRRCSASSVSPSA